MKKYFENVAKALLGRPFQKLDDSEQKVIESIVESTPVAENVNESFAETLTLGQRVADRVASFGGSWTFIGLFFLFIFVWILTNTIFLRTQPFDPYPYILLNLGLSTLAAFQAPIIMMSQNRQAAKDRIKQDAAFEVNLKLELEVMRLHQKLDELKGGDALMIKVALIIALMVGYVAATSIVTRMITRAGQSKSVRTYRIKYINKTLNIALAVVFFFFAFLVLGIEYSQVSLFLSSVFAVIGVALFAQWSILSNITASLIIFFAFPYRVGNAVRVVDKDDDIAGIIEEISLFHVMIKRGDDVITYPNNLILQKAVIKLAKVPDTDQSTPIEAQSD